MMNEQSIILSINRAAEQLFGYSAAEMIGPIHDHADAGADPRTASRGRRHFLKTARGTLPGMAWSCPLHKTDTRFSSSIVRASRREGHVVFTGFLRDIPNKGNRVALQNRAGAMKKYAAELSESVRAHGQIDGNDRELRPFLIVSP